MEARSDMDAQIVRYTRFLAGKDKSNHLVAYFFFCFFNLSWASENSTSMPIHVCEETEETEETEEKRREGKGREGKGREEKRRE